jgi:hypothetical protein
MTAYFWIESKKKRARSVIDEILQQRKRQGKEAS